MKMEVKAPDAAAAGRIARNNPPGITVMAPDWEINHSKGTIEVIKIEVKSLED